MGYNFYQVNVDLSKKGGKNNSNTDMSCSCSASQLSPEREIPDDENNIQKINQECRSKVFPFFLCLKYFKQKYLQFSTSVLFLHSLAVAFPLFCSTYMFSPPLSQFLFCPSPSSCINNPPRCRAAVCIFDLLAPWPSVESSYRGCYHHLFKLLLCLSCCLRENNGNSQQKVVKKAHPEVVLLHSASLSSSFRSCFLFCFFSLCDYEYGKKRRDVLGDVADIKSCSQLPGSWLPNDWGCVCDWGRGICIFLQVMRCTFGCLMGDIPQFLQLTRIWLFIWPEMDLSSYLGASVSGT